MVLDNYLTVLDDKMNVVDHLTTETLCFGTDLPISWLCCYVKEDAFIREDDALMCLTSVKTAIERLNNYIPNLKKRPKLISKFLWNGGTMAEEFENVRDWLSVFNPEAKVEIYFGHYGDAISLEKFRNSYGIGEFKVYDDLIPAEVRNEIEIEDFLRGL